MLLVGMALAGCFLGAEVTLGFNYATEMSIQYVQLLKEQEKEMGDDMKKAVRIRNYLYSTHTVGYSAGFAFGTGM